MRIKSALAVATIAMLVPGVAHAQSSSATSERSGSSGKIKCEQVFHIGDSLSVGGKQAGLDEGYKKNIGATKVVVEATGGQAVIEKTKGVSGAEVIASHADEATDDTCWVIAFGTNDSNNIAAGGGIGAEERIKKAVEATGGKGHVWWVGPSVDPEKTSFADAAKDFTRAAEKAHKDGDLDGVIDFSKYTDNDEWAGTGSDGIHLANYEEYVDFITKSLSLKVENANKKGSSKSKSSKSSQSKSSKKSEGKGEGKSSKSSTRSSESESDK